MKGDPSTKPRESVRIGVGAGFAGDRLEPAVALVDRGELDFLIFECLAERTIALAQQRRVESEGPAFDEFLIGRVGSVLSGSVAKGIKLITNGGAADPAAAAAAVKAYAAAEGYSGLRVAYITGDDVRDSLDYNQIGSDGLILADLGDRVISANAYLGAQPVTDALHADADVVITGRTADAALFLAPAMFMHGWEEADFRSLSGGLVAGHLLECGGQLTGGYFADGVRKNVPNLARLGFPYADVYFDASCRIGKLPDTGGQLSRQIALEQLFYEIGDPSAYLTPDATVDLSEVSVEEVDGGTVLRVKGAKGSEPPDTLKVVVGVNDGYVGEGEISYAGVHCLRRAELAIAILAERWSDVHHLPSTQLSFHIIGLNSCRPWLRDKAWDPPEVRVRATVRTVNRHHASLLPQEVTALYTNGPAGGGGVRTQLRKVVGIVDAKIPRSSVSPEVVVL